MGWPADAPQFAVAVPSFVRHTADLMHRFVGYLERRPYLWYVDLEDRVIEPAAELRDIPQGIDDVVPLESAVAVRCGPTWFALEEDLSGQGRPLDRSEIALAERGSARVDWPEPPSVHDAELVVPSPNGSQRAVSHPAIAYWQTFGTWAPDARTIAVGGFTQPFETPTKPIPGTYRPDPSVLVPWPQTFARLK